MFFKPTLTAAVLLRAFSPVVFDDDAEKVNFIFSLSGFETVTSPGCGNEIGHNSGFTLTTDQGVELYSNADPWGYSPCMLGGSTNVYTSDCIDGNITMTCSTNSVGTVESCSATYSNGYEYTGKADSDEAFYGIFVTSGSHCGGYFESALDCSANGMEWTILEHSG